MELIKKILFCLFLSFLMSCDGQNKETSNERKVNQTDSIQKENETFILQKQLSKNKDNFKYFFPEFVYQLIPTESSLFDLSINENVYKIDLLLDSASINIWDLKKSKNHLILIEGNDYYGSVFYVYYYHNNVLTYYGTFNHIAKEIEKSNGEKVFSIDLKGETLNISLSQNNKNSKYNLQPIKDISLLSIKDTVNTSELKEEWKKENFEIIKEKTADINLDGLEDEIYVLWNATKKTFPIYIILQKNNSSVDKVIMNENILSPVLGNSTGTGLIDIVCKNGYITFEENISEGSPSQNKYITFFYNKNDAHIYLHKYGIIAMYDDDSKDWEKTYISKNFGKINFVNYNNVDIMSKLK